MSSFVRAFLDASDPVPVDRPFSFAETRRWGLDRRVLSRWVSQGLLMHPIEGVYYAAQLTDSLGLRLECLKLVVPADAVVTDRTAGWLHGAPMVLAPGDHQVVPRASVFRPPGYRLRNPLAASGERTLAPDDVMELAGVKVTVPLRTACDLGRLLRRDQAFAALDALTRLGAFDRDELLERTRRYRGYRGIRQLRELAPLADGRSQSPGESILRLRWLDCGELPSPTLQFEVAGPTGPFFLDLSVPELRYAAEYDGEQWHGPEQRKHDAARREWVRTRLGYEVDVFTAANIHGPCQDADLRLRRGISRSRRRYGLRP
ncbi:conserved hypothetical protein [metagenome]|uniref:Transcriptional regulator, AbiEi antitoxin, Type IV TA system n=1 Tax=metagenome TaxID=256318 RepID=A0A2P2BW01_9ZZZZ